MSIRPLRGEQEPLLLTRAAARALGVEPGPAGLRQLAVYAGLLAGQGAAAGVTGVTDPAGVERRHLLESLAFYALLRDRGLLRPGVQVRVVDVGSGGGIPGLPLAILLPDAHVTLVEATARKARFLQLAASELALGNVAVIAERAETLGHDPAHREAYELAVSRAVAALPSLAELSLPLVRPGGSMAAIKGSRAQEELARASRAIQLCGGAAAAAVRLVVPGGEGRLRVVFVAKVAHTPPAYPRRPGIPVRRPLL